MKLYAVKSFVIVIAMISAHTSKGVGNARSDQKQLNKQLFELVIDAGHHTGNSLEADKQKIINVLAQGASINALDRSGESLLFCVIRKENSALVQFLIDQGIDVNVSNVAIERSWSAVAQGQPVLRVIPLYIAHYYLNNNIMRLLMDNGADVPKALFLARKYAGHAGGVPIKNVFIQKMVEEKREEKLIKRTQFCIAKLDKWADKAKRSLPEEIKELIINEAIT